jgi:acetyltransferase-like isoleucine patch superfamily enzyme
MSNRLLQKDDVREEVGGDRGVFQEYQDFFVGTRSLRSLIRYEMAHLLAAHVPGSPGYVLRKLLMVPLLESAGEGVKIGKGVTFRHPGKISVGNQTAIDDQCMLDARGVEAGEFRIGAEVLIARGTAITAKTDRGTIEIGDHSTIGKNCILSSSGGLRTGKWVGIGGNCYLGGGRYSTDRTDVPMMEQDLYTKGPVVIGDDCWIGAGARVLDGVTIGRGSIIGAGAIVREDVPEYTMVAPHQRLAQIPRAAKEAPEPGKAHDESQADKPRGHEENGAAKSSDAVQSSVYRAIDTLNQTRPSEKRLAKSPETPLEALDSIDKVNLIVETEMGIEKEFGQAISLANDAKAEDPEGRDTDPFETIASFTEYVESQLNSRL